MPKAVLEFMLPEDQEAFDDACLGEPYRLVLCDLDQWLRTKVKYEDVVEIGGLRDARDMLHELLADHDVSLRR